MTKYQYTVSIRKASELLYDSGYKACRGVNDNFCKIVAYSEQARIEACINCIYNKLLEEGCNDDKAREK